jgi:hypothetical protein
MVGGSNAGRLGVSLDNIGKPTVDVTSSGWSLTPANVNIIKALLEAECITKPGSPVVIYAMDNSCFMNMSSDSTISPIKKLEDGKYHVVGDLAITPGILLRPMYAALVVKLCGERKIYILTPFRGTFWFLAVTTTRTASISSSRMPQPDRVSSTSWTSWT